jgi:hypothetical protein
VRRRAVVIGVGLLAAAGAAAVLATRTGGNPLTLTCSGKRYTADDRPSGAIPRTLLLVDLSDNHAPSVDRIAAGIQPYVQRALERGGLVKLIVSGGDGQALAKSSCLNGRTTLYVARDNDTRELKDRRKAVARIDGHVHALLADTPVRPQGTATKLLADAPDELADMVPVDGQGGTESIVLWSDLLGSSHNRGDCLRLDGAHARPGVAEGIVRRCIAVGQLRPLPAGVGLRIVRGGGDQQTGDAVIAEALAASLCAHLATRCDGALRG